MTKTNRAQNLGELIKARYFSKSIKDEIRLNLIQKIKNNSPRFEGIIGYENTVIPSLENAILARHDINLLGLRGQAKTRIARAMVDLLDEYIPVIEGSELNEDPLKPITNKSKKLLDELKEETPISWLHRSKRYAEKLATPDVSIADLIGDIDPIKAANLKLDYGNEEVIHYGIIPRSNRGIFVINELPDLQPRIQVALFNLLQEKDLQIRGFKLLLPIDIQFLFTANPEDYTNRGAIITPLKDRIQSQIVTHYPLKIEDAINITKQEVKFTEEQQKNIHIPLFIRELVERISMEARLSEFVDEKSGISARLAISALECIVGAVERRMLKVNESQSTIRINDLSAALPAIVGKIEMVYEGEQEGAVNVGYKLLSSAIRSMGLEYLPGIDEQKKQEKEESHGLFQPIVDWFRQGNVLDVLNEIDEKEYRKILQSVPELREYVDKHFPKYEENEKFLLMEFVLHAMAEFSLLDKKILNNNYKFQDLFSSYFPLEN